MDEATISAAWTRELLKAVYALGALTGIAMLTSVIFVYLTIMAARRYRVLAKPSARGSHEIPTPRLGGVGVCATFYLLLMLLLWLLHGLAAPWVATIVVGGAWALVGGLLDDVLELNPRWKFLFQFAAAGTAVVFGFTFHHLELPAFSRVGEWSLHLGPTLGAIFTFGFIVFWMNAYNFMDGMDGQASLFGVVVSVGIVAAAGIHPMFLRDPLLLLCLILAGSLLGLLWFNYPGKVDSEKTFMGDAGSQFVGFLLAVFVIEAEHGGQGDRLSAVCAMLLLGPFAWDVLYTLVRRLRRGENIFEAHRSHLYQRLLIAGWSHLQVLAFNFLFWMTCAACALIYAKATVQRVWKFQCAAIGLELMALIAYTLFVLAAEKRINLIKGTGGKGGNGG